MYIHSHDVGNGKGKTILDTKVYVMTLLALWLNDSFLLSQLETKFALEGDLYSLILLQNLSTVFITLNITNCVLLKAKRILYFMRYDPSPTNSSYENGLV